jgi:hypothetical protein
LLEVRGCIHSDNFGGLVSPKPDDRNRTRRYLRAPVSGRTRVHCGSDEPTDWHNMRNDCHGLARVLF